MAKATEKDIDAAGDAMSVLNDISSGHYPTRDGDDCDDYRFDPENPAHLRKFYDLMSATLDASPGWPGRVIGGMCFVIMYPVNQIVDPDSDCLELHPRFAAPAPSAPADQPTDRAAYLLAHPEGQQGAAFWRDDALEKAAQITERYKADPWIARDIRAMKSAASPAPTEEPRTDGGEVDRG